MMKRLFVFLSLILLLTFCNQPQSDYDSGDYPPLIKISENDRYFISDEGKPFFWLGDTGWLLFRKLNREDAEKYLDKRKAQGFNVVQAMVIHSIDSPTNVYGDSAIINHNISLPATTEGNAFEDSLQYDYWDHVDYILELARERGIYLGLVPVWGSNVRGGGISIDEAKAYAQWLAERYKDYPNIIWLNGGDVKGSDSLNIWNVMGNTINNIDDSHLITFHPFGRTMSSDWFMDAPWLDFQMFQSGHRRYDQDDTDRGYGPDNWRYVKEIYNKEPVRPVVDGEPSYEGIPEGLHDTTQPYWEDDDIRRYAYWSVFAGAAGFTYGHNAVMQFYRPTDTNAAYGARKYWSEAVNDSGASQMVYLKNLILDYPYLERVPDQDLIAGDEGTEYEHLVATRGESYAMIYNYTGRNMQINMGEITGDKVQAKWYNPRNGSYTEIGEVDNSGIKEFMPPGEMEEGNDWVLVLSSDE